MEALDLFGIDIGLLDGNRISLYRELTVEKKSRQFF